MKQQIDIPKIIIFHEVILENLYYNDMKLEQY